MSIKELINALQAKQIVFKDVLAFIEDRYIYQSSAFDNGSQYNAENENQGSAKVLFFAKLNGLDKESTLGLFAEHYEAVLSNPDGVDHKNIRQFQLHGWDGVKFENEVLTSK